MKITIYTTNECEFSKKEKEYLTAHALQYEEKNLETNREFLTEMLAVSNNFAGTPVTKIEKDDGQIVVLKGFTPEEFDKTLGTVKTAVAADQPPVVQTPQAPSVPTPPAPTPPTTNNQQPTIPQSQPSTPPVVSDQPPVTAATTDPRMSSLLNNLQQKADDQQPATNNQQPVTNEPPTTNNQQPATNPTPPANLPNIPDPNFG